jgi:hypothetical protein
MRLLVAIAAIPLALACGGKRGDDKQTGSATRAENEDEERCDPKTPKVCVGNSVVACEANGHLGRRLRTCKDGCKNGRCAKTCDSEAVKLIYVVDASNNLLSFDPRKLPGDPFRLIGRPSCTSYSTPFSMSVDREGYAWVVYQNGELFKVSIHDAKCSPSGFAPYSVGSSTFGMGFVSDDKGSKTEKLYIAAEGGTRDLAMIDPEKAPPTASRVGRIEATIDNNPELTGTGEGKLYGFFPVRAGDSFIQEIDKRSGAAVGKKWSVGELGSVSAWAFAHWGGTFYVFVTTASGPQVRAVDRATGEYRTVMETIPYRITGAGVSTCAPELDQGQTANP